MRYCLHCKQTASDSSTYCEHCGGMLSDEMSPAAAVEELVRQLMADGRNMEAIKSFRAATGTGLAEAKQAVEAIARGEGIPTANLGEDFVQELLRLLREGHKIEAIKRHREQTNASLKESKDYVEALAARHGVAVPRVGCFGMVLGMAIAIGVVALAAASTSAANAVDLILHHGKIVTVDEKFTIAEALAVTGDRIQAVGKNDDILKLATARTRIVNLQGKMVIPGLADSHVHATGHQARRSHVIHRPAGPFVP